ncbi:hypothetical protein [Nitrosomonas communis]|nr:hypothetical protein [Nitrosomonas communis]
MTITTTWQDEVAPYLLVYRMTSSNEEAGKKNIFSPLTIEAFISAG